MVDSDDDFDKRNVRDKFRHERSEYEKRDDRKSRETFPERFANHFVRLHFANKKHVF
jgi:hypothetical protein